MAVGRIRATGPKGGFCTATPTRFAARGRLGRRPRGAIIRAVVRDFVGAYRMNEWRGVSLRK
jgi:hypothetical protein